MVQFKRSVHSAILLIAFTLLMCWPFIGLALAVTGSGR